MPDVVTMPPQIASSDRPFMWVFTITQTFILGVGMSVAGVVAGYLLTELSIVQRIAVGAIIFAFFFIGGVGRYKDTPVLIFLGSLLVYRIKDKKYVKVADEKKMSLYPPTQNWLTVSEIKNNVVKLRGDTYFTILKVKPIDLALRTADAMDIVYSRMATMYNTLDFPIQIIVSPVEYDSTPYIIGWNDKLKQYPDDSAEHQHIMDHIESFKSMIKKTNLITRNFYVCVPVRASQIQHVQTLQRQQKEDASVETEYKEKEKIHKEYAKKIYDSVTNELRSRTNTVAAALTNIDENLTYDELSGEQLVKALRECYVGGATGVQ